MTSLWREGGRGTETRRKVQEFQTMPMFSTKNYPSCLFVTFMRLQKQSLRSVESLEDFIGIFSDDIHSSLFNESYR